MTVFKRGKFYHMDFVEQGFRVHKTTKETNKIYALRKEALERERVKKELAKRNKTRSLSKQIVYLSEALEHVFEVRWGLKTDGLRSYRRVEDIIKFRGDINIFDIDAAWIDATRGVLRDKKNISAATINRHIANLKTILKEYELNIKCRIVPEVAAKELVFSKINEEHIIEALKLSKLKWTDDLADLFPVLIDTGMRLSEALSLTIDNILEDYKYIELFSKNVKASNTRVIPLRERTAGILKRRSPHFFKNLKPYTCSKVFKKVAEQTKLSEYTLHTCRHTFATRLSEKTNFNVLQIQYLLGHKNIKTTERYTHFSDRSQLRKLFLS